MLCANSVSILISRNVFFNVLDVIALIKHFWIIILCLRSYYHVQNALTDPQRVRTPHIMEYWKPLAEDVRFLAS